VSVRNSSDGAFAARLPLLPDQEGAAGPIAGLASAFRHGGAEGWDAILTLPCDTPLLPDDLPEKLGSALARPALAAVARSGGRLHPSCALWSVQAGAALPAYLRERRSLTGFAGLLDAAVVDWPAEPYDPFFNVNSEEDLAAAERLLRSR
jgi:molybdopterin-guanine dinucleotide biosynthesis protein A